MSRPWAQEDLSYRQEQARLGLALAATITVMVIACVLAAAVYHYVADPGPRCTATLWPNHTWTVDPPTPDVHACALVVHTPEIP